MDESERGTPLPPHFDAFLRQKAAAKLAFQVGEEGSLLLGPVAAPSSASYIPPLSGGVVQARAGLEVGADKQLMVFLGRVTHQKVRPCGPSAARLIDGPNICPQATSDSGQPCVSQQSSQACARLACQRWHASDRVGACSPGPGYRDATSSRARLMASSGEAHAGFSARRPSCQQHGWPCLVQPPPRHSASLPACSRCPTAQIAMVGPIGDEWGQKVSSPPVPEAQGYQLVVRAAVGGGRPPTPPSALALLPWWPRSFDPTRGPAGQGHAGGRGAAFPGARVERGGPVHQRGSQGRAHACSRCAVRAGWPPVPAALLRRRPGAPKVYGRTKGELAAMSATHAPPPPLLQTSSSAPPALSPAAWPTSSLAGPAR